MHPRLKIISIDIMQFKKVNTHILLRDNSMLVSKLLFAGLQESPARVFPVVCTHITAAGGGG